MRSNLSHHVEGLFFFAIPVGLTLFVLFETQLRAALHRGWPRWVPPRDVDRTLTTVLVAVACILAGASTHLLWDAFTHGTGFFVERLPILRGRTSLGPLGDWMNYRVLQHASSALGLLALVIVWSCHPHHGPAPDAATRRQLLVGSTAGALLIAGYRLATELPQRSLWALRGDFVVATLSGAMVGLLVACWLSNRRPRDRV